MDVRDWLKQYSINRYGKAPAQLMKAWDYLLKSVYGTFTDHPVSTGSSGRVLSRMVLLI